ncbi:hypothetical protein D3C86_1408580 [compost metagenome]
MAGINIGNNKKAYTAGLGLGHDFIFNKRLSTSVEALGQLLYLGSWDNANSLNRFQINFQAQVFKGITLFAGPVYSVYWHNAENNSSAPGYKQDIVPSHHNSLGNNAKGWLGFNAGITFM